MWTIDTGTWRAQPIEATADLATVSNGTLLVYGGQSRGLAAYSPNRLERFRLFADEDERVASVHVDAGFAYVVTVDRQETTSRVRAVDVAAGKVVRDATAAERLIDLALHFCPALLT